MPTGDLEAEGLKASHAVSFSESDAQDFTYLEHVGIHIASSFCSFKLQPDGKSSS